MPFDQAVMQTIQTWLRTQAPQLKCIGCGHQNWKCLDNSLFALTEIPYPVPPALTIDGFKSLAFVCLCCNHCGYTMLFDAHKIGLAP